MKILVVNMPCFGDNIPTVGFVKELARRGHHVDVTSSSFGDRRIRDMFDIPGVGFIDFDINSLDGYFIGKTIGIEDDGRILASLILNAFKIASDYDTVIYDYFAFPLYYLKNRNICAIRYFANFAFNRALIERMYWGEDLKYFQNAHVSDIGRELFGILGEKGIDFTYSNMGEEVMYNNPGMNIVHTVRELQPYSEDFDDSFHYVGSCGTDFEYSGNIPFDKMKGKIIYISFGTILSVVGSCRMEMFDGIIRAFAGTDCSIIMAVGNVINIGDFKDVPDNVYIYSFVHQTEVLERADLFVTHGGANSINDAVYYGVPMVVIPGAYDQVITADLIEEKGLGYRIAPEDFSGDRLKDITDRIFGNPAIPEKVREYQAVMRQKNCDEWTADLIESYTENYYRDTCEIINECSLKRRGDDVLEGA